MMGISLWAGCRLVADAGGTMGSRKAVMCVASARVIDGAS